MAKNTLSDLLNSVPSVDFGLEVFNLNDPSDGERGDGGRIVSGIKAMTDDNRNDMVDVINQIKAQTNTPLCESLFEAYRYFAGLPVLFGDNDTDYRVSRIPWLDYDANEPPRDTSIETNGVYQSPYNACSDEVYVILLADGRPLQDHVADTDAGLIDEVFTPLTAFPGITAPFDLNGETSYLASLSKWIHENDINNNLDGKQIVTLYTIGFGGDAISEAGSLLEVAATGKKADGSVGYFPAEDATELASGLRSALIGILNSASVD